MSCTFITYIVITRIFRKVTLDDNTLFLTSILLGRWNIPLWLTFPSILTRSSPMGSWVLHIRYCLSVLGPQNILGQGPRPMFLVPLSLCVYITYQIKKCVYNYKSVCIYVCVGVVLINILMLQLDPPKQKFMAHLYWPHQQFIKIL